MTDSDMLKELMFGDEYKKHLRTKEIEFLESIHARLIGQGRGLTEPQHSWLVDIYDRSCDSETGW